MEGSGEINSEDDKALSNRKRTFKTPFQLEALEKFYEEHKYPMEFLKLQLAEKIGLSEKQVSSWFCHRRLKDKRLLNGEIHANGRQDRSSGVVQDSCGSTKQGENKTQDPIEVQSSRFNGQPLSVADLTLVHGNRRAGNYSQRDDRSSGSSSSPHNLYSKVDHVRTTASKASAQNVASYVNVEKPRSGPSGYLKVKVRVENPAVTAIKMQLGAHYREDGPPLGVNFDPLPPGAFEPSGQQPGNTLNSSETYSAEEHVAGLSVDQGIYLECISKPYLIEEDSLLHSEDASRVHKQNIPNARYGYTPNQSLLKTVSDRKNQKPIHKSVPSESSFFQKHKHEFSLSKHRSVDMHKHSPPDTTIYDRRNNYENRPISSAGGSRRGAPIGHHQFQPFCGELKQEHVEPSLRNSKVIMPKVEPGDSFNSSHPDVMIRGSENDAYGDKRFSRKEAKVQP
ncbi:hypothetical protein Leryth_005464 [Lithospermum erythrorhizon]|nr:hypothetical protein Leryth_005464 [Lithospermum erythrorhizon]